MSRARVVSIESSLKGGRCLKSFGPLSNLSTFGLLIYVVKTSCESFIKGPPALQTCENTGGLGNIREKTAAYRNLFCHS